MTRPFPALLITAVLASLLASSSPAGLAQTHDDVDRAEAELGEARTQLDLAADAHSVTGKALVAGLAEYERINFELSELGFAALDLQEELVAHEAVVRNLRGQVEDMVVEAYIAGAPDPFAATVELAPGPRSVVASRVAAARSSSHRERLTDLDAARARLEELRAGYGADQRRIADLRRELVALNLRLDDLLAATETALGVAVRSVSVADAEYRAALTRYEEEQRRLAALGGVARWIPLVEKYFPPELVNEALKVMHCESRGNPDATNPHSDAAGLFQFMAQTWRFASPRAGFAGASRYDPEANVASAAWLVQYSIDNNHPWGRWGRWSCRRAV